MEKKVATMRIRSARDCSMPRSPAVCWDVKSNMRLRPTIKKRAAGAAKSQCAQPVRMRREVGRGGGAGMSDLMRVRGILSISISGFDA